MIILITGKQNAGKTTYSNNLFIELSLKKYKLAQIDGDAWRKKNDNHDYSDEGRKENLLSAAKEAQRLESDGYLVLLSFVAPRKEWRDAMRELWKESLLVYLPGGLLWKDTIYEIPDLNELKHRNNG